MTTSRRRTCCRSMSSTYGVTKPITTSGPHWETSVGRAVSTSRECSLLAEGVQPNRICWRPSVAVGSAHAADNNIQNSNGMSSISCQMTFEDNKDGLHQKINWVDIYTFDPKSMKYTVFLHDSHSKPTVSDMVSITEREIQIRRDHVGDVWFIQRIDRTTGRFLEIHD